MGEDGNRVGTMKCIVKVKRQFLLNGSETKIIVPAYENDEKAMGPLRCGSMYKADFRKARNPEHNAKAFVLIKMIFDNQEKYANIEDLRTELKLQCGSYTHHVRSNGTIVYIPKSWSFADMDQTEFEELYDRLIDVAINDWHLKQAVEFLS